MRALVLFGFLLGGCVEPIANMNGPIRISLTRSRSYYHATYYQDSHALNERELEAAVANDTAARAGLRSARRTERAGIALMVSGGAQLLAGLLSAGLVAATARYIDPSRTDDILVPLFAVDAAAVLALVVPGLALDKASERQIETTVGTYNERSRSR